MRRVHDLAAAGRVRFTVKAFRELAEINLDVIDALDVLTSLRHSDAHARFRSARTGEWIFVFKPTVADVVVYLKVIVRDDCIVVSIHEDEASDDDSP
ncbi:MAG: type II toxin-antitoxin system MqsR family toxin [Polyangiales bacterium]